MIVLLRLFFLLAVLGGSAVLLLSRLAFAPVPWPDASAFYLPGVDFFTTGAWRMHAQAAFVPSYDAANFNTMPALPLLFGATHWLRNALEWTGASLALRAWSLLPWGASAWLVFAWLLKPRAFPLAAAVLGFAILTDPVIHWGTLVVRPEAWIAAIAVVIIRELGPDRETGQDAATRPDSLWRISAGLALAAYFHFEAITLVPAVALGLWPHAATPSTRGGVWLRGCLGIAWRTLLLLSPWLVYVALHFPLFTLQMDEQFHRLADRTALIDSPYAFFHSLFSSLGSAVSYPKFFNLGKGLFWLLIALLTHRTGFILLARAFRVPRWTGASTGSTLGSLTGAALFFWATMALWILKYEVWFITLSHFAIWLWVAALWRAERADAGAAPESAEPAIERVTRFPRFVFAICLLFTLVAGAATYEQHRQIPSNFSWDNYRRWTDCLDRAIELGTPTPPGGRKRIWQPHVPDALVELASKRPHHEYTRAQDFALSRERVVEIAGGFDAIVFSRVMPADATVYEGPERAEDADRMRTDGEIPHALWLYGELRQKASPRWRSSTCHFGPFWAVVTLHPGRGT